MFPGNKGARIFSQECWAIVLQALRSAPLTTSQRDASPRCKFSRQSFFALVGKLLVLWNSVIFSLSCLPVFSFPFVFFIHSLLHYVSTSDSVLLKILLPQSFLYTSYFIHFTSQIPQMNLSTACFPYPFSPSLLKVHKIENFFGSEFEFYTISLLVMLKY